MKMEFFGAAGEVTGSRHLLDTGTMRVLLDCGLFQGHRREAIDKNKNFPFSGDEIDAVVLSHAHIDHSGALPLLVKSGFRGPIHCTEPTAELCALMLLDSARIQEEDAKYFNKIHQEDGETIEPLYDTGDANAAIAKIVRHPFNEFFLVGPGLRARFVNAGHVVGSAMIELECGSGASVRRLFYTGDLGRRRALILKPPEIPKTPVDYLFIETTYGNRVHEPINLVEEILRENIQQAIRESGKILIPSFAFERTQEIIYIIDRLHREKKIPRIDVYVDSPMAVGITEIFNKYGDPYGFDWITYVRSVEESKRLNDITKPCIIISSSGMCEGGRILHHLRNNVDKENVIVLLVGYQAQGTLGYQLANHARKIKIFGLVHEPKFTVRMMHHFSAHADRDDLTWFITSLAPRPRKIFLVHGDSDDRQAFAEHLKDVGVDRVALPNFRDEVELA
jgi:metallo-beta-lactamase family protein